MFDVAIIGAGIIGSATAMELSKYNLKVAIIEKDTDVANETTKANSGIIHSGYDPESNTLMAKYSVDGCKMAKNICERLSVPYKQIGSLVIAFDDNDIDAIKELYNRGLDNGVSDMEILSAEQVYDMEPNLSPGIKGALLSKSAGIVSPYEYAIAMCENAVENGVELFLETAVTNIEKSDNQFTIYTNNNKYSEIESKYIINSAGVWSDKIHDMVSEPEFKIIPKKGEYFLMDKSQGNIVNHIIFQCPNKDGKGVLITPTAHGNLIVGPNSVFIDNRDDVSITTENLEYIKRKVSRTTNKINYSQCIRNFAGVRATSDQEDFIIGFSKSTPKFLNIAGIKSPGLTAAPAIAVDVVNMLKNDGLELTQKENFISTRKRVCFSELSIKERQEAIKKNPLYGRIICRCENVTEGEIIDELNRPIIPRTTDAIKRRCNAGMGRCQGGFCSPKILEIMARELNINPVEIRQDKENSYILTGITKMSSTELKNKAKGDSPDA